jgi:hypothetical protein
MMDLEGFHKIVQSREKPPLCHAPDVPSLLNLPDEVLERVYEQHHDFRFDRFQVRRCHFVLTVR